MRLTPTCFCVSRRYCREGVTFCKASAGAGESSPAHTRRLLPPWRHRGSDVSFLPICRDFHCITMSRIDAMRRLLFRAVHLHHPVCISFGMQEAGCQGESFVTAFAAAAAQRRGRRLKAASALAGQGSTAAGRRPRHLLPRPTATHHRAASTTPPNPVRRPSPSHPRRSALRILPTAASGPRSDDDITRSAHHPRSLRITHQRNTCSHWPIASHPIAWRLAFNCPYTFRATA